MLTVSPVSFSNKNNNLRLNNKNQITQKGLFNNRVGADSVDISFGMARPKKAAKFLTDLGYAIENKLTGIVKEDDISKVTLVKGRITKDFLSDGKGNYTQLKFNNKGEIVEDLTVRADGFLSKYSYGYEGRITSTQFREPGKDLITSYYNFDGNVGTIVHENQDEVVYKKMDFLYYKNGALKEYVERNDLDSSVLTEHYDTQNRLVGAETVINNQYFNKMAYHYEANETVPQVTHTLKLPIGATIKAESYKGGLPKSFSGEFDGLSYFETYSPNGVIESVTRNYDGNSYILYCDKNGIDNNGIFKTKDNKILKFQFVNKGTSLFVEDNVDNEEFVLSFVEKFYKKIKYKEQFITKHKFPHSNLIPDNPTILGKWLPKIVQKEKFKGKLPPDGFISSADLSGDAGPLIFN